MRRDIECRIQKSRKREEAQGLHREVLMDVTKAECDYLRGGCSS